MSELDGAAYGPNAQWNRKLFFTLHEAVEYTGLSQTYLRRLIEQNAIFAINDGGYKISRIDLDRWNTMFVQHQAAATRRAPGRAAHAVNV